ncbi:uncharacterized membrane protein YhaH (DUF805 family) [Acidovorax soli]|uniref:Uncharacterized membrane protein YhaH (DUF805 family) n=1 Tax=Acidovorax soli TaxID=592050 RepID=A0A7X0UBH7_9BURK|nr:DUF4149 domain-containing protein [Acidovorax soli]MBB6562367.1 uncharacterized membrane protein YhaH (DUF805 family) [Acidovorax soli]
MLPRLPALAAALWWGSLTTVGFLVVPMLFANLPSPALAGQMAAKLFAAQTWVTVVCCMVLLLISRRRHEEVQEPWAQAALGFVLGGLLLALLVQYGVSPRIVARQDLRLWHSVGTGMYVLQWVCALVVLWRTVQVQAAPGAPVAAPPAP